ncbi:MAG: response regulator [Desulforhopalus sp.]|nr:response regulator [Desulforhopalus sp.]
MSTTKHAPHPKIAALLVFCIVVCLFIGLEVLERQRFRETLQTRTINTLSQIRAGLEAQINANFYLTRGLIAFISIHPQMDDLTFQQLARQILDNRNYIRNIALAPDNVVRFVYPLQGNERAVGLRYQDNAEQWPSVARIIASRKAVIAGPVNLVQGGLAFVSRTPIYLADDPDGQKEDKYWGLASIVIEKENLFKASGLYDDNLDIRVALRGKDGLGAEGDMIEGDPAIFQDNPVLLPVNLPEGSWLLAGTPKNGWLASSPYLYPLRISALVLAALLGLAAYTWLQRQEENRRSLERAWQEAKKAQADLRLNEEFLNTVIDNIPAMVFVKDPQELRFIRFNKTGAEMLGYEVTDFIGKNDFDFFPENEARFFINKDREVLNKGTLIDIPEELIETREHTKMVLHTRKIPIFDAAGNPLYLLGIAEDITQQQKVKAEKEHLEKLLHRSQKLETIGKMAGGVAHDLNNILSGIINYPEILLLQLPPDSPLRKPLTRIHDSGKRAAKVVADLLTIARGVAAVKENICLNTLVSEYLDSPEHQRLASAFPALSFVTRFAEELWISSCSPVHLQKCLMNLINNSAEAIPADTPGVITISSRNEILAQAPPGFPDLALGRYVVLSVTDSGTGINPADLEHIFEPFYTRKAMGRSGTGLGLTVVWNTMEDHHGAVTVESSTEAGTTFSLYLPATDENTTISQTPATLADLYGQGQHVLVVDDDPQQRDIAVQILQELHYSAEAVASGEEAIQYLHNHHADLVILDMLMEPGLNGRQTYENIILIKPGQKAIIVSGFADSDDISQLKTIGAGIFIKKPYSIEELGVALRSALQ